MALLHFSLQCIVPFLSPRISFISQSHSSGAPQVHGTSHTSSALLQFSNCCTTPVLHPWHCSCPPSNSLCLSCLHSSPVFPPWHCSRAHGLHLSSHRSSALILCTIHHLASLHGTGSVLPPMHSINDSPSALSQCYLHCTAPVLAPKHCSWTSSIALLLVSLHIIAPMQPQLHDCSNSPSELL